MKMEESLRMPVEMSSAGVEKRALPGTFQINIR
jgi:hypothetical protein